MNDRAPVVFSKKLVTRKNQDMSNHIYLYFYDPLQIINFNYLNMQICHIISCHVIFSPLKIFLKIQGACHIIFLY
jgi:hypothetical protein